MVGLSSETPFCGFFPEILGYTHACAFCGSARFPHTGGDIASQSLICVCTDVHTCVWVWCESRVCGLCASKLYPIKKKNGRNVLPFHAWVTAICYMELRTTHQDNILADWQATILFTWKEYRRLGYYVNTNRGYKILPLVEKLALEIQLGKGSSSS